MGRFSKIFFCFTLSTMFDLALANTFVAGGPSDRLATDCEGVNSAIQALPPEGGTVELGAGTFICHSPIVINRDSVELKGQGPDRTILKLADSNPAPVLVIGVLEVAIYDNPKYGKQYYPAREVQNISVSKLRVDGNLSKQPPDAHHYECYDAIEKKSLSCDGDGGKYIRNNGITVRRANHIRINNVESSYCLSGGLTIEKKTRDLKVNGYLAKGNYFDGLAGYETDESSFENIILSGNLFSGISVDLDFEGNIFRNVLLFRNGDNGVFSANVSGNHFENMIVVGNHNYGIYFDGRRLPKDVSGFGDSKVYFDSRQWARGLTAFLTDWEMVPGTCDNQHVENSLVISRLREGLAINHVCRGLIYKNTSVYDMSPGKCMFAPFEGSQFPGGGAEWTKEGIQCRNAAQVVETELDALSNTQVFDHDQIFAVLKKAGIDEVPF